MELVQHYDIRPSLTDPNLRTLDFANIFSAKFDRYLILFHGGRVDTNEGGFGNDPFGNGSDSVAQNGIFDVYIRLAKEDGSGETKHLLTTMRSGESFDFEEINDHGEITVSVNGRSIGDPLKIEDSTESYFKFGNYLQVYHPVTGSKDYDQDEFEQFYKDLGITESTITMTNLSYTRNVD